QRLAFGRFVQAAEPQRDGVVDQPFRTGGGGRRTVPESHAAAAKLAHGPAPPQQHRQADTADAPVPAAARGYTVMPLLRILVVIGLLLSAAAAIVTGSQFASARREAKNQLATLARTTEH